MVYEMMYFPKEATPQTVPVSNYPTDVFSSYADSFDLSLLPSDFEVPQQQTQHNLASSASPQYIPATIFNDLPLIQSMKQEKNWLSDQPTITTTQFSQYYTNPCLSPPQDQFLTIFPPSPCSSLDGSVPSPNSTYSGNSWNLNIKQEFGFLPPSPPDSTISSIGSPSPCNSNDIKVEPVESESESCIDINSLLDSENEGASLNIKRTGQQQEYQVLREYLQDTTFQRKHNLKPLALESFLGWTARGDIEPVISLALEYARKDVEATCVQLDISPDPQQWTASQVQAWLESTISQFKLQPIVDMANIIPETGQELCQMTEEQFVQRSPQAGSTLHAQLEIWKAACTETSMLSENSLVPTALNSSFTNPSTCWSPQQSTSSDDEDEEMPVTVNAATPSTSQSTPSPATTSTTPSAVPSGSATTAPTKARQGSSHIHLWQFLKELLASPQVHGTAIRWLDRSKGIFKIEDSVRVARLWGRRKNRPAMNYDKLSRSIRQYYKKGIMKKTERSQRLVYQFCHPYCL